MISLAEVLDEHRLEKAIMSHWVYKSESYKPKRHAMRPDPSLCNKYESILFRVTVNDKTRPHIPCRRPANNRRIVVIVIAVCHSGVLGLGCGRRCRCAWRVVFASSML